MDLASVGLFVDGSGAIRTLNQFTGSAHNAARAGGQLEGRIHGLGGALRMLGGYFGIRQLIEYADTWTLINSRIGLVTNSVEETIAVQQELYEISQRTRNTLAATAVLYTRLALNASELGRSHQDLLDVVETVNAAMLISGSTGVEAAQSMRQLAQALGAGRLQGDEFRTVMEAMPEVARLIAKEMGVTRGELYKLSREGKISVNIIMDALLKAHDEMTARAAQMPLTIGQSFTLFMNAAERMIGVLNMAGGVSGEVSGSIEKLATNMDKVVAATTVVIGAWITWRLAALGVWSAMQLVTAGQLIQNLVTLVTTIRAGAAATAAWSLASKGIIGVAVALAAAGAGYIAYKKLLEQINEQTEKWLKTQADLSAKIGKETILDPNAEARKKELDDALARAEDMKIQARQALIIAGHEGRYAERMQIVMDAINKLREARRDFAENPAALRAMEDAIIYERDFLLLAENVTAEMEKQRTLQEEINERFLRFIENAQRGLGDVFYNLLNQTSTGFDKLAQTFKQTVYRMLADLAASETVKRLSGFFGSIMGATSGTAMAAASPVPSAEDLTTAIQQGMESTPIMATITPDASAMESFAAKLGPFLAVAIAGFGIGSAIGGMTSNRTIGTAGGALAGAAMGAAIGSIVPVVGTAIGAAVGGITGALGGLMGSSKKHQEELEKHRAVLAANNEQLEQLRRTVLGSDFNQRLGVSATTLAQFGGVGNAVLSRFLQGDSSGIRDLASLMRIADELGIELDGSRESFAQLQEAIDLTIRAITQWGNNLQDQLAKQEAYNRIFGVEDTPQQRAEDSFAILMQMAPALMQTLGLSGLDPNSETGREAIRQGFRDIYQLIASGQLTPEMLGGFADKNELIDIILKVIDSFDALDKEIMKVTTDFPRAMDIVYYEQKYGRYGQPRSVGGGSAMNSQSVGIVVNGNLDVHTHGGETGEEALTKIENAARERGARGGMILMPVRSTLE
jgi:tape measure domain-containing protein